METLSADLPNGSTGDSLLLVRGVADAFVALCDAGDPSRIPPREILRLAHLCVSHCHVDHFVGFDQLVRPRVCREESMVVHGPEGFLARVASRLGGYTWNLVDGNHFVVEAREVLEDRVRVARFDSGRAFARQDRPDDPLEASGGGPAVATCWSGAALRIETAALDHHVVSQGYALQRPRRLTVDADRVASSGQPAGPWLARLKDALARDDRTATIDLPGGGTATAAELARDLVVERPGERVAYVTDTACTPATRPRIVALAAQADVFACGAPFLDEAAARAVATRHLTASQAGAMAAEAGARTLLLFHASDRYGGRVEQHVEEADRAAGGRVRVEVRGPWPLPG